MNWSGFYEWNLLVRWFGGFDGCVFHGFHRFNGLALRACRKAAR